MKCSVTLENLGDITILIFLIFNRLPFVVVVYWLKWLNFQVKTYLSYNYSCGWLQLPITKMFFYKTDFGRNLYLYGCPRPI